MREISILVEYLVLMQFDDIDLSQVITVTYYGYTR